MTSERNKLPSRRFHETVKLAHIWGPGTEKEQQEKLLLSVGRREDGRVGEVFLNYENQQMERQINTGRDIAVLISIALQYGAPLDVLRAATARSEINRMGKMVELPHSIVGTVLDKLIELDEETQS